MIGFINQKIRGRSSSGVNAEYIIGQSAAPSMRIFCWILLLLELACQSDKSTSTDTADAVRDLLVDRMFWQTKALGRAPGTLINLHHFALTNTSQQYTYREIEVRLDYYDSAYHKIDSSKQIVKRTIHPREAIVIDQLQAGTASPGARSSTVTIITASAD